MAISDNKITNAEIAEVHVQAAPDTLTGSAQQNKAVFDAYSDLIKEKHNSLIDDIDGEYASNWRNGSQTGSVRTTGSEEEGDYYTIGQYAAAEGRQTKASGSNSHAEGFRTQASKYSSHAEGHLTNADGNEAHAEGRETLASGNNSHAEGQFTNATGDNSHAEGNSTEASGNNSHAEGYGTIASSSDQHVSGRYNIEDTNNIYAEIIGNGTSLGRGNGRTLDWNGNEVLAGKLTVGTEPENNKDVATKGYVDTGLAGKVDKVTGKGLSTEDYTTSEKAKLSNIESGAEVNVQADWETNDTNSDAYINNKPYIPNKTSDLANDSNYATEAYVENGLDGKVDKETGKGLSANDYTSEEKAKLEDIEAGAEVNVQSDWAQNNSSADDYIKNKPTLPTKTSDLTNDSDFTTKEYVDGKLPIGKASGTIASVKDGADEMPMKSLVANIVPKQSGSGTPSPENVREISGWESVETVVSGVNVWDEEWERGSFSATTGEKVNSNDYVRTKNPLRVAPNANYYIKAVANGRLFYYDANGTFLNATEAFGDPMVITTPSTCAYMNYRWEGQTYANDISINYPSTDHDYHAYTATTHTTSLGRTVYGGTVDVVRGTLTVTHAMVDLGSLNWNYQSAQTRFYTSELQGLIKPPHTGSEKPNYWCSSYKITSFDDFANSGDCAFGTTGNAFIMDSRFTDATAFKTAVSGQMLCYELSTPTTYTLTPQQINTLAGVNNVWVDSGDCSIEYVRDIGLALDNLLPDSPTTDGTYTLVCTVSDGKATIAWQSSGASLSSPLSMSSPASLNINTTEGE